MGLSKFFNKSETVVAVARTMEIRSALVRVINRIDTTDGKVRVVKIGDKFFRVRELG